MTDTLPVFDDQARAAINDAFAQFRAAIEAMRPAVEQIMRTLAEIGREIVAFVSRWCRSLPTWMRAVFQRHAQQPTIMRRKLRRAALMAQRRE